jgi:hypothetical protein
VRHHEFVTIDPNAAVPNPADATSADATPAGVTGVIQPPLKRRTPGWVPVLIGVFAFLLVLAGSGLTAGDWISRNSEMNLLVTRIEASESSMQQTQDELAAIFAEYEGLETLTAPQKAELTDKLKAAAAAGDERVTAAGRGVREVAIMPWHGNIAAGKQAYVIHNQAWQDYLGASAKDPDVLLVDQPEIDSTFMASEPLLKKAVPEPPLFDLKKRVRDIFIEGQAQPDGPTQEASLRGAR